jgi:nucleoside-diphosphate-sugar epimerase
VLILGGTRFIGRRIAADLVARGDEVTVVHRGQTETVEPDGCVHLHTDRAAFASVERREEFILRRVRAGRRRIPVGAGTSLDTRCYVGDVAAAALAALDHPAAAAGQVFNVGDPVTDTVRDYAVRILAAARYEAELVTVPEALVPDDMESTKSIAQHFLIDSRKATSELGWRPSDPAQTIPLSVRWHLAHPPADPDQDFSPDDRALAAAG